jgi:hypothetical protein
MIEYILITLAWILFIMGIVLNVGLIAVVLYNIIIIKTTEIKNKNKHGKRSK